MSHRIRWLRPRPAGPPFTPRPQRPARCEHAVIALAPVAEWSDWPIWRCVHCRAVITDCPHTDQRPTDTGWQCAACSRTLLSTPPVPPVA